MAWASIGALLLLLTHNTSANQRQCLANINNMTIYGKTDNQGHLLSPSTTNATAITYKLCVSQCGNDQQAFQWTVFSQQFGVWLLPWLALISQIPFGANDNLDNLETMLLTVGSPVLAAYSLGLTVLNERWIIRLFSKYRYPNAHEAVRILNSLQQSPLRVDSNDAWLASLIVLPQNKDWWREILIWLDYTHTWSISAVASIAWVIIAYVFTIIDYFSQGIPTTANDNGQGIGSIGTIWLWLLAIVVGWLKVSPKCDSKRLLQAVERANSIAYVATTDSIPCEARTVSDRRAISLNFADDNEARRDERSTSPIFNYSRLFFWVEAVKVVSDAFNNASDRSHHHEPIIPGVKLHPCREDDSLVRLAKASQVEEYCLPRYEDTRRSQSQGRWGLDSSTAIRISIASLFALILQWGTTGAAIIINWFVPTIGLGCRSASFIIYGALSTIVWIMLLISSLLTYYSVCTTERRLLKGHGAVSISYRIMSWFSVLLRRSGKIIATLNTVWIISTALLQFGSFYDRCYCNSNVFGSRDNAYNVIIPNQDDATRMREAWIGGFSLASMSTALFIGFVFLLTNAPYPNSI
ncbi:hypothetical protein CVT25_012790 [Psilocybe cyanescens]|uniref:Uncharacterized protein n=1 Tax=Psilocybe cyanescens TaxID=93625 RepID=A0A409XLE3_PSICY|nr:hypothetical protein CVT25_012790 [Psilocybe cyanescens]